VLLLAGQYDPAPPRNAVDNAGPFGYAELAVRPSAGQFPWLDDLAWLTRTLAALLG
jgi:hypothetical protein